MEKKIANYLHLYIGSDFVTDNSKGNVNEDTIKEVLDMCERKRVQLVLRPISSMTYEEWGEIGLMFSIDVFESVRSPNLGFNDRPKHVIVLENRLRTNTLLFNDGMLLLRFGFDLFGLIESGLAIPATKELV